MLHVFKNQHGYGIIEKINQNAKYNSKLIKPTGVIKVKFHSTELCGQLL